MVSLHGVIGGFVGGRLQPCGRGNARAAAILVATMQCVIGGVYFVGVHWFAEWRGSGEMLALVVSYAFVCCDAENKMKRKWLMSYSLIYCMSSGEYSVGKLG